MDWKEKMSSDAYEKMWYLDDDCIVVRYGDYIQIPSGEIGVATSKVFESLLSGPSSHSLSEEEYNSIERKNGVYIRCVVDFGDRMLTYGECQSFQIVTKMVKRSDSLDVVLGSQE